ncbi:hypothetical protein Sango_0561900 [Sesamum angolense]|uniref:Stigma-specific Stig1 family protein n=1 Tax=Sesamum angolense TaxID=2727404 RepID=A0AAE1X6B5_9LAMI|nr:hypothetical protein Sango_0561900 [Sesamum angolense]
MLISANHFLKESRGIFIHFSQHLIVFLYLVLIITSHVVFGEKRLSKRDFVPSHLNFLRGRKRVLWCGNDPDSCLDPEKNPWGGTTCCFQRFCRDMMNDPNNCGSCGRVCAFGLSCCGGNCVDTRSDPHHCGACFEECSSAAQKNSCSYSMCDYGG